MKRWTRLQKIIVGVLALLNLIVIGAVAIGAVFFFRDTKPAVGTPPPVVSPTPRTVATWTPTITPTPRPTLPPRFTNTPTPTSTPIPPTATPIPPTATPVPTPMPVALINPDFDMLMINRIPGWKWDALVNYKPGGELNPESSYAEPFFSAADDPIRQINGSTLKIETMRWVKYRAWIHQTLTVTVGTTIYFEIKASAYSSLDRISVKAGIDPTGAENCYGAKWGQVLQINQDNGIVKLSSPKVKVLALPGTVTPTPTPTPPRGEEITQTVSLPSPVANLGRVTVCFFAEPTYPHINNAAFFDQATLVLTPLK